MPPRPPFVGACLLAVLLGLADGRGVADEPPASSPAAQAAFRPGQWNHYRIVVRGDHYRSWVNGVPTADFRQPDDPEGFIGFQVHSIRAGTGPYSVRWRAVRFREIR